MSYQTREQSLGYILKALIDSGSKSSELKLFYSKLHKIYEMNQVEVLNNYSTYDYMVNVARDLKFNDERTKRTGSFLYNAYDIYTVDEAKEFYYSFKTILRIKGD